MGDFNAKIQEINNKYFNQKVSKNGIKLLELMKRQKLVNANNDTETPTYLSPDGKNKSILDYVFEHEGNEHKINNLQVDRDDIYRVESSIKDNIKKSDHRTIFFEIPWNNHKGKKKKKLN